MKTLKTNKQAKKQTEHEQFDSKNICLARIIIEQRSSIGAASCRKKYKSVQVVEKSTNRFVPTDLQKFRSVRSVFILCNLCL